MPSAANHKIDKQVSPENAFPDLSFAMSLVRQNNTLLEHKIRNLEKRKSKLESYRDLQNAGKELNADQKTAVAKYNEVTYALDFIRDVYKQCLSNNVASEKEAKKQAKRDAAAKNQAELARLREILLVQDALNQMGNETVREDFLNGRNGAVQLTEAELKLLDDVYSAVTPKHEAGNPTAFSNGVQTSAEHLQAIVEGKTKEVFGGTYNQIKEILGKIYESGYFDQLCEAVSEVEVIENSEIAPEGDLQPLPVTEIISVEPIPQPLLQQPNEEQPPTLEAAPVPDQLIFYQAQPPQPLPQEPQQQTQQPQPQQQPPRPITEMLGTGSFFFLQESEIDTPPEQIPSQTFTNQSFVTSPPAPHPLPQNFQNVTANLPSKPIPYRTSIEMHDDGKGGRQRPNFYQNNNGYNNNRPRQNRSNGGSRSGNRH